MGALEDSLTDANLKHAFARTGGFGWLRLNHEQTAQAAARRDAGTLARAAGGTAARNASHQLAERHKPATQPGRPASELAAMIGEHSGSHAGMARTAHGKGFDEIAVRSETMAGRPRIRRTRHDEEQIRNEGMRKRPNMFRVTGSLPQQ